MKKYQNLTLAELVAELRILHGEAVEKMEAGQSLMMPLLKADGVLAAIEAHIEEEEK
jgi:hypothetical protein